jgi:hypothetical protein
MPSITLTPGSSASSIISLTFNAGASLGNISFNAGPIEFPFDDPYSYLILTVGGTYYWATSGGVSEDIEALNPSGSPVTSAEKDLVVYSVRGLVQPAFIQAGFNYLLPDGFGNYTWCNSSGTEEDPAVSATSVDELTNTASREGEIWSYVYIIT